MHAQRVVKPSLPNFCLNHCGWHYNQIDIAINRCVGNTNIFGHVNLPAQAPSSENSAKHEKSQSSLALLFFLCKTCL